MPPRFTLAVSDFQYVVTFGVMLAVALIIANLVANVRAQTRVAGARERRTSLLYAMSRELTATRSLEDLARVAVKHVAETFSQPRGRPRARQERPAAAPSGEPLPASLRAADLSVAQWVFDHSAPAGLGTDTLPAAPAQYLPLKGELVVRWVCWPCSRRSGAGSCFRSSVIYWRLLPHRLRSHWSARISRNRPRFHEYRRKPKALRNTLARLNLTRSSNSALRHCGGKQRAQ